MPMPKNEDRCTFIYRDGRRCRMSKIENHPYLCFHHWQRGQNANDALVFASQLLPEGQQLTTATTIAAALTCIFRLISQGRLETRQAGILAYICQQASQILPRLQQETEAAADARGETSPVFDTIEKGSFEEDYIMRTLAELRGSDHKSRGRWIPFSDDEQPADEQPVPSPSHTSNSAPSPAPSSAQPTAGANGTHATELSAAFPSSAQATTANEDDLLPGSIPIPGSTLYLPPPLEPEVHPHPNAISNSAACGADLPAGTPSAAADTGDLQARNPAALSDLDHYTPTAPNSRSPAGVSAIRATEPARTQPLDGLPDSPAQAVQGDPNDLQGDADSLAAAAVSGPAQPPPIASEEELRLRREARAREFGPPILTPLRFLKKHKKNRRFG